MARYPKAKWLPVSGSANDPTIRPIGVILHVDGGNSSSLYRYFNGPSGGIESTLFVNKKGAWEQYRDTTQEADAQAAGNSWVASNGIRYGYTSVETQGVGGSDPWNAIQLAELAEFLVWHHKIHGTPLELCIGPKDSGIGYHALFSAWNPNNHECPGTARIKQVPGLIRLARELLVAPIKEKVMGTFIYPAGPAQPGDGIYYVDEQGVWPVNAPRWSFLTKKGTAKEALPRAEYAALVSYANPQQFPDAAEVAAEVIKRLPTTSGGAAPSIEEIRAVVVQVVNGIKVASA